MRRTTIAISLLTAALLMSNAWWAYRHVDIAVTRAYQSAAMEESQQALAQALAVIHASALPHPSKASVVQAAHAAWPAGEPFERDGYLWVGRLGLRFDEAGKVIEAVAGF